MLRSSSTTSGLRRSASAIASRPSRRQPHDLDPLVGAQQGRGALAHELVVVSHDHPYRHRDRDGSAG